MGQPGWRRRQSAAAESIGGTRGTVGTETSQYREEEKSSERPGVVASETGAAQTGAGERGGDLGAVRSRGCRTVVAWGTQVSHRVVGAQGDSRSGLERRTGGGESPVGDAVAQAPHRENC